MTRWLWIWAWRWLRCAVWLAAWSMNFLASAISLFSSHLVLVAKSPLSLMHLQTLEALSFVSSTKVIGILFSTPCCVCAQVVLWHLQQQWIHNYDWFQEHRRHRMDDAVCLAILETNVQWRIGSSSKDRPKVLSCSELEHLNHPLKIGTKGTTSKGKVWSA